MNIAPIGSNDAAQSARAMGDLLKQTTTAAMGLEHKLLTASVTEQVENQNPLLGNGIDVSA
jgi:hypothetical protein